MLSTLNILVVSTLLNDKYNESYTVEPSTFVKFQYIIRRRIYFKFTVSVNCINKNSSINYRL